MKILTSAELAILVETAVPVRELHVETSNSDEWSKTMFKLIERGTLKVLRLENKYLPHGPGSHAKYISEALLPALNEHCELEDLRIDNCVLIPTDEFWLSYMKSLKSLVFVDCDYISWNPQLSGTLQEALPNCSIESKITF